MGQFLMSPAQPNEGKYRGSSMVMACPVGPAVELVTVALDQFSISFAVLEWE